VSPFDRRRLQTLQREVRPLVGRDIGLSAGPGLERDIEVDLLLRVLGTGSAPREMASAFTERLLALLGSRH
jgi:hypothetical protein